MIWTICRKTKEKEKITAKNILNWLTVIDSGLWGSFFFCFLLFIAFGFSTMKMTYNFKKRKN